MNKFLWTRAITLILTACAAAIIAGCSMAVNDRVYTTNSPMRKTEVVGGLIGSAKMTDNRGGKSLPDKRRTWKHSSLSAHKVKIKIGDKESLPIHSMKASVKVDGFRARVILDYHFYNHHNRNYEATFQMRLPTGASPYYMAFGESIHKLDSRSYKNGDFQKARFNKSDEFEPAQIRKSNAKTMIKIREARMVNKKKAVRAYHNTVQRRIDPALLEWTGSGVFNGRLFPVQAKKIHRVVIAYDVDLTQTKHHHHLRFGLPNKIKHKLIQYSIATTSGSKIKLGKYHRSTGNGRRKLIRIKNPKTTTLDLSISRKLSTTLVNQNQKGQSHFISQISPKLNYRTSVNNASKAVFLIDISAGAQPESFNRTIKLMTQLLSRNQTRIKQFAVLFFNSRGFWWRNRYSLNNQNNRQQLQNFSNKLSLQGASDIDLALSMATRNKKLLNASQANIYLLSDGAANWGETQINTIARKLKNTFNNKLFAFSTSTVGVNTRLLNRLSASTNGAHYTVTNDQEIRKAAIAIRANSWKIKNIKVSQGSDIIIKGNPSHIYPGQILTIAGRGRPNHGAKLLLTISDGTVTKTRKYRITRPIRSALATRAYGLIAVDLMESYQRKQVNKLIESYALHFRVVGRNASLLMLESEKDYQSYNIKPADNQQLVEQTRATHIINSLIKKQAEGTRSDKQVFISMLKQLKYTDGVKSVISKELDKIIVQLPKNNFSLRFQLPKEYKAIELLSDNAGQEVIDITSNKAQKIIIQKFNQLLSAKQSARAVVALSSLVELNPGNVKHMRLVNYYLLRMKKYRDAWFLFKQVARRRAHEPPAYLALARIAAENNKTILASLYYEILVNSQWDGRFRDFKRLALIEYQMLLRKIVSAKSAASNSIFVNSGYAKRRLDKFVKRSNQPKSGIMVAIEWNSMGSDIDLHIKNPDNEHIYYGFKRAQSGAIFERDNTRGMGPEIFRSPTPLQGRYKVGVKYFGNNSNKASLRTAVLLNIYRNVGTAHTTVERKVITLKGKSKVAWINKFYIE